MTKLKEIGRVGCVTITSVEAEWLDTPTTYMLDCDYGARCEWGIAAAPSRAEADRYSIDHADFHAEYGPDSRAWIDTFVENEKRRNS